LPVEDHDDDDRYGDLKDASHQRAEELSHPAGDEVSHLVKAEGDAVEDGPARVVVKLDDLDVDQNQEEQRARDPHLPFRPLAGILEKLIPQGGWRGCWSDVDVSHVVRCQSVPGFIPHPSSLILHPFTETPALA